MFFNYTDFADGLHKIQLRKSVKDLGIEAPFIGDVVVNCNIDKSVRQIIINCEAECTAEFMCDRCSSTYEETLIIEFTLIKVFNLNNVDPNDSCIEYHPPEKIKVDITKDLKEFMYLSIPMKKLCSDDCKGLCIHCGINLNLKECSCEINNSNQVREKLKNKLDNKKR